MASEFMIRFYGIEALEAELIRKSNADFLGVQRKQLRDIYTRGQDQYYQNGAVPASGGTPYDQGELRISMSYTGDETGYSKDYGPHVEFGHMARGGGSFVPGQYFLKKNVDAQKETYKADMINELRK